MAPNAVIKHSLVLTDLTHLRKNGNSLYLRVPYNIHRALEWHAGQTLLIGKADDYIVVMSLRGELVPGVIANEPKSATKN
jgi:hypothetical protein